MINTVHIQYSTASAGRAAFRLHNAFRNCNINSNIISLYDDKNTNESIRALGRKSRAIANLDSRLQSFKLRKIKNEFGLFSYPILGTNIAELPEVRNADIIYIHWALHGFLNLGSIERLAGLNKPVVFFMHDMWAMTGGCHYSFTCEKYYTKCSGCQFFSEAGSNDPASKGFEKKLSLYSNYSNFYFISPSQWLYECAKRSLLVGDKPLFYIPNVITNEVFKPFDKGVAKGILNIRATETVIAFGAVSVDSPYKGWSYLRAALDLLYKEKGNANITVLVFGGSYNKQVADSIPFKTKFMGYLQDEHSLNIVYNAADVFIIPSIADNQPTTVMESLSCGTPVVGFNTGGIPDMIRHKANGYLSRYKDPSDLVAGINFCLNNKIRGYVLPEFDSTLIVKKHQELFQQVPTLN